MSPHVPQDPCSCSAPPTGETRPGVERTSVVVTYAGVLQAHERIREHIHRTPIWSCSSLARIILPDSDEEARQQEVVITPATATSDAALPFPTTIKELLFKCENLQKIGAFKIRGALNAISLSAAETIVTHSSGNHAQAVALACQILERKAIVVMPKDSPQPKVDAVRDTYGAEVRFCEPNQAARESMCADVINEVGSASNKVELIHPYDDPRVVCGQGTLAVEFLEDACCNASSTGSTSSSTTGSTRCTTTGKNISSLDAIVIAVGGGGLLAGCATAIRGWEREKFGTQSRKIKIIAAEPLNANDCYQSFTQKTRIDNVGPPKTIADSVKTNLGEVTLPIILREVDHVIQVSEDNIKRAMKLTFERSKLVVEPGAAVAVAAAMSEEMRRKCPECLRIGVVLCGGNLDIRKLPDLLL
ncbi:unnamed protein product [Amoebophrya sp. A25]|nr:unnamed protein product [Amoebophrya sp. A25]|eukprot:GSA25T00012915001.1